MELSIENKMLNEHMLQEAFLDSVRDYANEKYNQVITKINDWKDAAAIIGKVISNPTILDRFSDNVWYDFKRNILSKLIAFLEKIGLKDLINQINIVVNKITNLKGWQKFLAATGIGAIANYILEKMTTFSPSAIRTFIGSYLSDSGLKNIISKLTDFKSYLGWLQPIIKGVDMLYSVLKSTINKFKSNNQLFSQSVNLIKKENMLPKDKKIVLKLKKEISVTGTGASVTPGINSGVATKYSFGKTNNSKPEGWTDAPSVPNRKSKAMDYKELWEDFKVGDKVTYLGHPGEITAVNKEMSGAITYNVSYDKGNGKTKASNIYNKDGEIKPLEETLQEGYAQFKNSTKTRTKPEQFHQAVKEVKKKVNEINRLFEYMDRLKSELNEGEELKYKKYTERSIQQIKESTKQLFFKSTKLK